MPTMIETFNGTHVNSLDAHQVRKLLQDNCSAGSIVLVDASDLALYPVGPVQIVT